MGILRNLLDLRAQQLHDLTARVKQLEDDLALQQARHERLRGRFYATRGNHIGPPARVPREELLRRFKMGLPLTNNAEVANGDD